MKQTEIGLIPDDWKVEQLNEYFEVGSSKRVFQSQWRKAGIPFYRAREIVILSEKNTVENELFIDESLYNQFKTLYGVPSVNDLLVTGVGTLGKVYKVQDTKPFYFKDGNIICLKNKGLIDSDYVKYHFDYSIVKNQINDNSGKSTVGTYTINSARKTLIPIPPLAEQQRIAKALSDVDAVISTTEKLIQKKKNIKQGAMQNLLTGKKRLPGFAAASKFKQTELGEIPEDWEMKTFGDYASIMRGGSPRPIQNYLTTNSDGINWIKIGDVKPEDKYIVSTEEKIIPEGKSRSREVHKGDFILSNSMSFGRPYILQIDGCIHDGWLAIQNYQETFDTDFLYYLLGSDEIFEQYIEMAAGSSVQNLNKEKVAKLLVPIFDKKEQTAIANVLSSMDKEIENLNTKLEKYRNLKTAMMQQLLTGKIRL